MKNSERLESIEILLQRLEAAVVVRDLGNAHSADAYDGLRKQIIQSGKNHRMHVAHLLSLADSMERGADLQLVRDRVNDFLNELGVERFSDISLVELFEVTEGEGSALECIEPAIIEKLDNGGISPIRLGKARRVAGPEPTNDTPPVEVLHTNQSVSETQLQESQQRRNLPIWIALIVLAFLSGLGLSKCGGGSSDNETPDTLDLVVTTEEIVSSTTTEVVSTTTTADLGDTSNSVSDSSVMGGQ
jgi:hypothetical protein